MELENQAAQETAETTDGFLEGWEDDAPAPTPDAENETQEQEQADRTDQPETTAQGAADGSDPQDAERQQAEQQAPPDKETGPAGAEAGAQEQQAADAPKLWTLRHMDEVRQVGEADMVVLAQKGMDYDRIRSKYDESKPVMEMIGGFARQNGMSIPDFLSHLRTQAKQAGGMTEAEARRVVELEDREAAVAVQEAAEAARQSDANQAAQEQAAANARRNADIAEFQKLFPDAAKDPKAIPPEVWASVRDGMSLVSAYSRYAVEQARAAQQAAEQKAAAFAQNQRNAARSTGSMQSAGENRAGRDPFLEGFDS